MAVRIKSVKKLKLSVKTQSSSSLIEALTDAAQPPSLGLDTQYIASGVEVPQEIAGVKLPPPLPSKLPWDRRSLSTAYPRAAICSKPTGHSCSLAPLHEGVIIAASCQPLPWGRCESVHFQSGRGTCGDTKLRLVPQCPSHVPSWQLGAPRHRPTLP